MLLALWLFITTSRSVRTSALILAGEPVRFSADMTPRFTANQTEHSDESTRAGLARWAKTDEGRKLLAFFSAAEYEIRVEEDAEEEAAGRAPQPGIATLAAARDHKRSKSYELILNPAFFRLPRGMQPLLNEPATPADMMAIAWAGEMLHIYFYAQGISLPHHPRSDFQQKWDAVANELGMALVQHNDDEGDYGRPRRALLIR